MAVNPRKQKGGAINSQAGLPDRVKIKKENGGSFMGQHNHKLSIQFKTKSKPKDHTLNCTEPQTVLEAIKSCEEYKKLGWSDDKIMVQWGTEDKENIVATHFPCSCLKDNDTLIVSQTSDTVEERRTGSSILPKDEYSVFYIDTVGGTNAKTKKLFISSKVKQFKFLCVYGEKNITVRKALERDGRFNKFPDFKLRDISDPDKVIQQDGTIEILNGGKFKLELPRGVWPIDCGRTVREEMERRPEGQKEMEELLSKQFPDLRKQMESRFPGNKFQEALNLKKENFGKIRQDFSEVHTIKKLLEMGESVCLVSVGGFRCCKGTGFVLVDNLIMTNAHLFKGCTVNNKLKEGTDVYVLFRYENLFHTNYLMFKVEDSYICFIEDELDYAVLKVSPQGETWSPREKKPQKPSLPPGLLEYFGEIPVNGGACIIGHPGGGVKQIDLTCVIEPKKRKQAAEYNLRSYRQSPLILHSLVDKLKAQGIDRIMMGGDRAEKGMTYNTFMYHGSSGSPVFDAQGRVCALHTSGYIYEFPNNTESVMEFGQSLEIIMKHLVKTLNKRKDQELLRRIREVSDRNPFLKKVF